MKLLVTGAWKRGKSQIENLRQMGHEVVFMQNEQGELPIDAEEIEGVICNGLFLYHDFDKFTTLKYVQLTSAGYDRVPLQKAREKGISVFNARGVYSIPMAEYAVWGVLSLYKKARFFENNRLQKRWDKYREMPELFSKTVAIIGCGNVGSECAVRFKAFGCKVVGVDLFEGQNENFDKVYGVAEIDEVIKFSDVVVLTLPLTEQTRWLINGKRLQALKQGAILVNIARGAIICEEELIKALKTRLLGAVLDVFEQEPLSSDSELWNLENVIVTPHNSFVGDGNEERLNKVIFGNVEKWQ